MTLRECIERSHYNLLSLLQQFFKLGFKFISCLNSPLFKLSELNQIFCQFGPDSGLDIQEPLISCIQESQKWIELLTSIEHYISLLFIGHESRIHLFLLRQLLSSHLIRLKLNLMSSDIEHGLILN